MTDLFDKSSLSRASVIHFDGACQPNPGLMGIGWTIHDPDGNLIETGSRTAGSGTNNIAEYLALIEAMEAAPGPEHPQRRGSRGQHNRRQRGGGQQTQDRKEASEHPAPASPCLGTRRPVRCLQDRMEATREERGRRRTLYRWLAESDVV